MPASPGSTRPAHRRASRSPRARRSSSPASLRDTGSPVRKTGGNHATSAPRVRQLLTFTADRSPDAAYPSRDGLSELVAEIPQRVAPQTTGTQEEKVAVCRVSSRCRSGGLQGDRSAGTGASDEMDSVLRHRERVQVALCSLAVDAGLDVHRVTRT